MSGSRSPVRDSSTTLPTEAAPELVNPSVRTLGFSPDGSLVTFWARKPADAGGQIGIWAAPTLGGQPKPYLEGAAEFDWSHDGSRLTYHTAAPGDPLFVSDGAAACSRTTDLYRARGPAFSLSRCGRPMMVSSTSLYGALPDKLDIWRIKPAGGQPERITSHNGHVSHPVLLNRRTLMYLANDPDGSGPWLYSIDVERRIPHRLTFGPDRYTSLAATADGKRLVVTRASPKRSLWRMRIGDSQAELPVPARIAMTPATAFSRTTGAGLSYMCLRGRRQRKHLETGERNGHGAVEWSWSSHHWQPRHFPRWRAYRIFGPSRLADPVVCDASGRK